MSAAAVQTLTEERTKWVGRSLPRKEDARFVTGRGQFVGDIRPPNLCYAAFLRSPYPNARIVSVDAERALALPGVLAVVTGKDLAAEIRPLPNLLAPPFSEQKDFGMAVEVARYVGEPVAMVVATSRYEAYDALEEISVEYEPSAPVVSPMKALRDDSPLVHANLPSNAMWHREFTYGDVDKAFSEADLTVKDRFHFHRFTSAPLEPNAAIVSFDRARGTVTVWTNNQRPAYVAPLLSKALKIPLNMFHFISPDIGGGFGIKVDSYPYILILVVAARRVGRPIVWEETRREHMLASTHGNEVYYEGEMALHRDGTVLGYRARAVHDEGAYMRREPLGALNFIRSAVVTYSFKSLSMDVLAVATNKCPVGPNRAYGKMQQNYFVERMMDSAARRLGMDPVEFRMKNLVGPELMPYETPTGSIYDGGDFPKLLANLVGGAGYRDLRKQQALLRAQGRVVGIGVAFGMDSSPVNPSFGRVVDPKAKVSGESEAAWIRMNEDASVSVAVGTSPQGQGHETSVSQIVADILGLKPSDVNALSGFDTWTHPYTPHSGTYASRFAVSAAPAVAGAADKLRLKILRIAGHLTNSRPEDLVLEDGRAVSSSGRAEVTLKEVAEVAWKDLVRLPKSEEPGLLELYVYRTPLSLPVDRQRGNFALSYSTSACLVMVELDRETGEVRVKKVRIVEDSGTKINPMLIEGQVHGQIAHQLGAAILERHLYDEEGQLLTSTFMDYSAPSAADLPSDFEVDSVAVPSPFTALGARGTAEGGGAPLIACVNAVNDALAPAGATYHDSYVEPRDVLLLLGLKTSV